MMKTTSLFSVSGVYKIQSKINGSRIYIGSSVHMGKRWGEHLSALKSNKHHSCKLQRHVNKYGIDDLSFSVLLECEKHNLISEEQRFMNELSPYFNVSPNAGSRLGTKLSEEHKKKLTGKRSEITKQRMRDNHPDVSGKNNPMYGKIGDLNPNKGKAVSEEARKNLSKALSGLPKSDEHKLKIAEAWKDREICRCIYCGLETNNKTNITRWHNEKCKHKPII